MEVRNGTSSSEITLNSHDDRNGEDEDWLESDDEEAARDGMVSRDSKKVQSKLYDEGYRSGITKGKESMVQVGFDSAYNLKGAPLGRKYGFLLGTITALSRYTTKMGDTNDEKKIAQLLAEIKALNVYHLAEPDWEALEHEGEHGADITHIKRETDQEALLREQKLDLLMKSVMSLVVGRQSQRL